MGVVSSTLPSSWVCLQYLKRSVSNKYQVSHKLSKTMKGHFVRPYVGKTILQRQNKWPLLYLPLSQWRCCWGHGPWTSPLFCGPTTPGECFRARRFKKLLLGGVAKTKILNSKIAYFYFRANYFYFRATKRTALPYRRQVYECRLLSIALAAPHFWRMQSHPMQGREREITHTYIEYNMRFIILTNHCYIHLLECTALFDHLRALTAMESHGGFFCSTFSFLVGL